MSISLLTGLQSAFDLLLGVHVCINHRMELIPVLHGITATRLRSHFQIKDYLQLTTRDLPKCLFYLTLTSSQDED